MAGIDKIYGTQYQYKELYDWLKVNRPSAIKYLYDRYGFMDEIRPISNFSDTQNAWLLVNCPLKWVTDRIKFQYGMSD